MAVICEELEKAIILLAKLDRMFSASNAISPLTSSHPFITSDLIDKGILGMSEFVEKETTDKLSQVNELLPKIRETILKAQQKIHKDSKLLSLFYMQSILGIEHDEEKNRLTFPTDDGSEIELYFRGFSWVRKNDQGYYGCLDISKREGCHESVKFNWVDGKFSLDLSEDLY